MSTAEEDYLETAMVEPLRVASWTKTPESERAEAGVRAYFEGAVLLEKNLPVAPPADETDKSVLQQYKNMGYGWSLRVRDHENIALKDRIPESLARAEQVRKRARDRAASPAYKDMSADELTRMIREDDEFAEYYMWQDTTYHYGGHETIFRQFMLIKWPGHPLRDLALELWGQPATDDTGTITIHPLNGGHQLETVASKYEAWSIEEPDVYAEPLYFADDFKDILTTGFVVTIGCQNYRITVANTTIEGWYEDPHEIEVTFAPTDDPVSEQTDSSGSDIQFFGEGRFQQDSKGTEYKGQMCYTLFTGDPDDRDMTWTMMFNTDEAGKPCRLWLEISCT